MSDDYDLDAGPDPAAIAARDPEPSDPADPVLAVGVGPGNREYLTPRAERAIEDADVVIGFETVVDVVRDLPTGDVLTCGYADEGETLATFASRVDAGASGTAVLMGDPNHSGYQFVGKVQAAVDRPVRVVPGISSLQIAASRARTPMEETTFVTLHKSGNLAPDRRRLRDAVGDHHLLVLPRPYDHMPPAIATDLLDAGAPESLAAIVYERLTHENEAVTRTTLGELATRPSGRDAEDGFSDLTVLAVRRP
jgi:cobalt-precorrin-7 (C5)-methyltransferase